MQILNSDLIQLSTAGQRFDIEKRPFSVAYCFQSPNPMSPEEVEEHSLYFTKITENGDIMLSERAPEKVHAKLVVPHRVTELAVGTVQSDRINTNIELLDENTTEDEVMVFSSCIQQALQNA